jgi:multiple sugar transport system permease protein/putative aldouronate transport system permease protein
MATIKDTGSDKVFLAINNFFLILVLLVVAYPLIFVFSSAFSSPRAVVSGRVWLWPVDPSIAGFQAVFRHPDIGTGYFNSLFYMVAGTVVNLVFTIAAAYPLSRRDFFGKGVFTFFFTFTILFNGGVIPLYLLVRTLGILNTRWAMVLPNAIIIWNMIIARTYFKQNIPEELREAARIDGCGDVRFLFSIVLPLSGAIIAVLALFYAVFHWNSYFNALIFLRDKSLFPLQIILREILILADFGSSMTADIELVQQMQGLNTLLRYSLIVAASVPLLIIYPFVQRFFVKGVMLGSLKG